MSIEYNFAVSTESSVASLLEVVQHQFDLSLSRDQTFLDGVGVQMFAAVCSQSYQEMLEESFGSRFDIGIRFRLSKDLDEREVGYRTMLEVVVELLKREAGQAVLLFNDEIILLQRFDGDLVLNLDWQTWQKQGTDLITLPYRMQSLPSPLL